MNTKLLAMYKNNELDFKDVFELYAAMCVDNIRDITEDMILYEGVAVMGEADGLSVESLTERAVDWGKYTVGEMIGGDLPEECVKKEDETWLNFVIRAYIEQHVKDNRAFRIKLS